MKLRLLCSTATIVCVAPVAVTAQTSQARDMPQALADLRSTRDPSSVSAFLTQEYQTRSEAELSALADSLIGIATAYRTGDPPAVQLTAHAAAEAFVLSANTEYLANRQSKLAANGLPSPVPFAGAFESLVKIYRASPSSGFKGGVLYFMTELPDNIEVTEFLGTVARSETSLAMAAIRHLGEDMGDGGLEMLKKLYNTRGVIDPTAKEHLDAIATRRGWSKRSQL